MLSNQHFTYASKIPRHPVHKAVRIASHNCLVTRNSAAIFRRITRTSHMFCILGKEMPASWELMFWAAYKREKWPCLEGEVLKMEI